MKDITAYIASHLSRRKFMTTAASVSAATLLGAAWMSSRGKVAKAVWLGQDY